MRIFKADRLPKPATDKVFPDTKLAVDLEIGAGAGMHSLHYARQNPERYLIAIERTKNKYEKFLKAYKKEPLDNLLPIHADAILWITHHVKAESIENLFLFYPNPEPNNKNQRWIHMPFFSFLLDRLKPRGKITMATNLKNYAEEFYFYALENWHIENRKFEKLSLDLSESRSHFEKKYLARGETCYQVELIK